MIKIGMLIADRYEILEKVGTGGMADVYKSKDHTLNRYVAVKVLKQEFSENANFVSKFRVEAQAAAGLMHPNIVNVYDVGEEKGLYYIVMELVDGITLKKYIEKKARLSVKETTSIAIQVSMGLEAAHRNHIIHRDIKPQNIIISRDGKVKVTDFGIAKAATSNTITSNVMGSVHYTSPEQARGGFSDEKSDIYSLGITMFEMLTGRVPFNGETTVAIAIKHIQQPMPSPCEFVPEIPRSLELIVLKCCEKSPDRRYQNITELISDLKQSLLHPDDPTIVKVIRPDEQGSTRAITRKEREELRSQTGPVAAPEEVPYGGPYPEDGGKYADAGYSEQDYGGYAEDGYQDGSYPDSGYTDSAYADSGYPQQDYSDPGYPQGDYPQEDYPQEDYPGDARGARRPGRERHAQDDRRGGYARNGRTQNAGRSGRSAYPNDDPAYDVPARQQRSGGMRTYENSGYQIDDLNDEYSTGSRLVTLLAIIAAVAVGIAVIIFAAFKLGLFSSADDNIPDRPEIQANLPQSGQDEEPAAPVKDEGIIVPDVLSRTRSEANKLLKDKNFEVNIIETPNETIQEDYVISQEPEAQTKAPSGSTVTIYVSSGPDIEGKVKVPDVVFKPVEEAMELLAEAGLSIGEEIEVDNRDASLSGKVMHQSVEQGTYVEKDTKIDLEVAKSVTYSYVADIQSPAAEDPSYVPGTTVYVIVRTDDGIVLLDALINSFPYPVKFEHLAVSSGTLQMAYTNMVPESAVLDPNTGQFTTVPATTQNRSVERRLTFTPEN